ncbi:aldo/keto reductase [Pseudanabaena sp. FACHB-2040]|uniref:aldo/keto reductase n=1 Tax=Pseudanabaena sp. FACHB-2040 TaxID=2692859 RepID=UPI00168308B1|nr:aldo/keto reductase [Pseudanabaena sp. FACHB-2040]MBD2256312.1 aldo/keto reductase [Pseudanabaena sp. FACHB-2040]
MRTLRLPSGQLIPVLGLGTWKMGESARFRQEEVAALRHGLDLGMTLIDTAEMYGQGEAETVIAEAIAGRRSDVFLVSKVYPHNATHERAIAACERSLQRLQTDYLDLYLLHWRGSVPLSETLEAFETLKQAGKIRAFGVSNFDVKDLEKATALPGGDAIATNQVLYNLMRRGIEWDLLPWCRQRQIPVMAYSPVEQGRLLKHRPLQALAQQKGVSAAQLAIAWLLHQDNVIVIPKASSLAHVEENQAALKIQLSPEDLAALDEAFPPPAQPIALEML